MLDAKRINELGLYLRNQVCVSLNDGTSLFGKLKVISPQDSCLQVDEQRVLFADITDVEYVGEITDYHTIKKYGEIGRYSFEMDSLDENLDPQKVLYAEYDCKVACHLSLGTNGIHAVDIRLLETAHRLNAGELRVHSFFYRYKDGSYAIGQLTDMESGYCIRQPDGTVHVVDAKQLTDVTKAPEINDYVMITKTDGTDVRGTVSANDENDFVVIEDTGSIAIVAYEEVAQLRFRGSMIVSPPNLKLPFVQVRVIVNPQKKGFSFLCKPAYFRTPVDLSKIKENTVATFVAGVNNGGLIAKDIVLDETEAAAAPEPHKVVEGIGVITYFDKTKGIGYIGKQYITKGYHQLMNAEKPVASGKISFTANQLDFKFDFSNISVVAYSYNDGDSVPYKALSVKLVENYPFARYAYIKISPDGNINAVSTDVAYLPLFKSREVEITTKEDNCYSGWLKDCSEQQITLLTQGNTETEELVISASDVAKARAYGSVGSYRQDNGMGYIDNYWFHINNLRNNNESNDIVQGRRVIYALVNTSKGKFYMADDISIIKEVPVHGYLTGYDGVNCSVFSALEYGRTLKPTVYPVASLRSELAGRLNVLNLKQYDYPVTYIIRKKRLESSIVITHIDIGAPRPKIQLGYVFKYVQRTGSAGFGFITLPEDFENQLNSANRKGTIYFRESDILSNDYVLDTHSYYYTVAFSISSGTVAGTVAVLGQEALPSAQPKKEAAPEMEIQRIPLQTFVKGDYSAENYCFGLINFCSTHVANINNCFINRKFNANEEYTERISFDPEKTGFVDDVDLRTSKYSYLVRYAPVQGEEITVDENHPVEVLQAFPKQTCVRITLDEEYVVVESVKKVSGNTRPVEPQKIPELHVGESVVVLMADQSVLVSSYQGETDESMLLAQDRTVLKDEISMIYRFAVVTGLDMDAGTGTLNGSVTFSLAAAETKMVNILKNQVNLVRLHVMYSCSDECVDEVRRIPEAYLENIPWVKTRITACVQDQRQIVTEDNISHFISVLSDGLINRMFKQNQLVEQDVFVRSVSHYFLADDQSQPALGQFALEIHCFQETATIQYDAGRDIYLAYRNPTYYYPVSGAIQQLRRMVGSVVPVEFEIDTAGNLRAFLGDVTQMPGLPQVPEEDPGPEELAEIEEPAVEGLAETSLVALCLRQADMSRTLIRGVVLNENGMPADTAQAQRAYAYLRGRPDTDSMFMAAKLAEQFPDIELSESGDRTKQIGKILNNALQKRCREIGMDANAFYGEMTYCLTTLLHHSVRFDRPNNRRPVAMTATDCLYQLFLMDFGSRQDLNNHIQANHPVKYSQLRALLQRGCGSIEEFTAHLMQLDKTSIEMMIQLLESNDVLRGQFMQYAGKVDDTMHEQQFSSLVQALRDKYNRDKARFRNGFAEIFIQERVCARICELIGHMRVRFLKLACADDALRFERLYKCCQRVVNHTNKSDFVQQEMDLKGAYQEITELEKEILSHPTRECVDILILNKLYTPEESVFSKIRYEISTLLNHLYQNSGTMPKIMCQSNDSEIIVSRPKIWLVLKNGTENMNIQPADNLVVYLESYSEDASVPAEVTLSQNHLSAGEQVAVEVDIELINPNVTRVAIGWSAKFDYADTFADGVTTMRTCVFDDTQPLEFLVGNGCVKEKDLTAANPYEGPAGGQPLLDSKMFFGRKEEKKLIWDSIVQSKGGRDSLIPGSAVIIYGQKKCGKTSLVYQIRNDIQKNDALRRQAIVLEFNNILELNGGAESLGFFRQNFYRNILNAFRLEIHKNHPDVEQLLRENDLEVPSNRKIVSVPPELISSYFDAFFKEFALYDQGRHVIFLVMDEFTLLCTTILKQIERNPDHNSIETIPNFIKTFSQYGFVQLIIGHEAMMQALGTLGVLNHTSEFAKSVEISALAHADAEELVCKPMKKAFKDDVYGTILGKRAVQELLDLSGCSPTYLMRLCDRMFKYYVNPQKCVRNHILPADVENMTQEYVQNLLLKDFDVLLVEDGDEVEALDARATFKFLKSVADISSQAFDHRTADINQVQQHLERLNREHMRNQQASAYFEMEKFDSVRNLLEARRVISTVRGGRIQVNVGLFCEFITQKYGGR